MYITFSTYQNQSMDITNMNEDSRLIIILDTGAKVAVYRNVSKEGAGSFFIDQNMTEKDVLDAAYSQYYDNYIDQLDKPWFRMCIALVVWNETLVGMLAKVHGRRQARHMRIIRDACTIEVLSNGRSIKADNDTFEIGGTLWILPKVAGRGCSMMLPNLIRTIELR